ncbi:hypothetical protein Golax_005390, partial [Gossypium laxum]|nr:hypothetical protein [Gossypium laxum]MBA0717589.1 hypothetical protein [Gossypium laxum]
MPSHKNKRTVTLKTPHVFRPCSIPECQYGKIIPGVTRETSNSGTREFYTSLKDQMIKRGYNAVITDVEMRCEDAPISPNDICEFYNILFYEKYFIDNTDP